jgi:GH15 family glucan-1,4-alpha-glucosidase
MITVMPHPTLTATSASTPIADYGLLADCNGSALLDRAGSIDWLCMPRYDSPAIFARLLDPDAGHWSIRPAGPFDAVRRYLPGSLAIETTFTTDTGKVRLIDAMAAAEGQRGHDLGFDAPHELLRAVEGVEGDVQMVMELAARPEYGLIRPLIRLEDGGARTFGSGRVSVRSSVPLEVADATMRASFRVRGGEAHGFALRWASAADRMAPDATPADAVRARIDDTVAAWRSWEDEHDV